ncbi:MAG: hypothetical protein BAA01_05065 [Bacillus thermozeamaize]|uniref:HTH cro/C1-type domain-containing protein n=1 Tax=Bacillus thermozeamaize TaxID=230954 RepID=A0A1Y3PNC0_9BACI|nr:MAG: hypothetical protein BAA01_05065 [Bacillus thermozeamaize]
MAEQVKARINPEMLVWARKTAGYSQEEAARKISTSVERLQKWECGEDYPTIKQLRKIGSVFKRPTAIFYKKHVPEEPVQLPDFRLVHDMEQGSSYSPRLRLEIRKAMMRREIALDLASQLGEDKSEFNLSIHLGNPTSHVARQIREALNVSLEEQYSWRNHYEALRTWVSAMESIGILVFQFSDVEVEHARGFSIGDRPYPVIAVNSKDTPRGRIFTLFHELTHILMRRGGVCDLHDADENMNHDVEAYCNRVAGESLVPTDALLAQELVAQRPVHMTWEDWELRQLANRFMVSQEVILRRLLTLGKTDVRFYNRKRNEFLEQYKRQEETKTEGKVPYYRRVLSENGRAYTYMVLNAWHNELISTRDVSNFLGGINLEHVNRIEKELFGVLTGGGPDVLY